jgi:hypothetical protein
MVPRCWTQFTQLYSFMTHSFDTHLRYGPNEDLKSSGEVFGDALCRSSVEFTLMVMLFIVLELLFSIHSRGLSIGARHLPSLAHPQATTLLR